MQFSQNRFLKNFTTTHYALSYLFDSFHSTNTDANTNIGWTATSMGLYSRRRKTKVFPKCTIFVIGWLQVKVLYFPENGNVILTFYKAILFSDLKPVNEKIIKTQLVRFAMPLERYILWWKYTFCKIWEVNFWNLRNTVWEIQSQKYWEIVERSHLAEMIPPKMEFQIYRRKGDQLCSLISQLKYAKCKDMHWVIIWCKEGKNWVKPI